MRILDVESGKPLRSVSVYLTLADRDELVRRLQSLELRPGAHEHVFDPAMREISMSLYDEAQVMGRGAAGYNAIEQTMFLKS